MYKLYACLQFDAQQSGSLFIITGLNAQRMSEVRAPQCMRAYVLGNMRSVLLTTSYAQSLTCEMLLTAEG